MAITTAISATAPNSAGDTVSRIQGRQDNSVEGTTFSVSSEKKQSDVINRMGDEKESAQLTQKGVVSTDYLSSQEDPAGDSEKSKKDEEGQLLSVPTDPVELSATEVVMTNSLFQDPSWSGRWLMPVAETLPHTKPDEAVDSEQQNMQFMENSTGLERSDGVAVSARQFAVLANAATGVYESGLELQKSSLTAAFNRTLPASMVLLQQNNTATSKTEYQAVFNNVILQNSSSNPLSMGAQLMVSEHSDLGALTLSAGALATSPDSQLTQPVSSSAGHLVLPAASTHEWEPIKMASAQSNWGQQLVETLKERVEMQINQNVKQAHIRLDPPELGKLELTVRFEGDRLSVQVNAANPALRDALLQSSDRLRMSLMTHHSGGVEVNVGQGDRQQQNQPQQELFTDDPVLAGRQSHGQSVSRIQMDVRNGLNALV